MNCIRFAASPFQRRLEGSEVSAERLDGSGVVAAFRFTPSVHASNRIYAWTERPPVPRCPHQTDAVSSTSWIRDQPPRARLGRPVHPSEPSLATGIDASTVPAVATSGRTPAQCGEPRAWAASVWHRARSLPFGAWRRNSRRNVGERSVVRSARQARYPSSGLPGWSCHRAAACRSRS
jgi:hypothetical protein